MIRALFAIVKLDLSLWRRMPFAIFAALVPPIGMTLVIVILSLAVLQQPVALVIEGKGPNTEKMQKLIEADTDAYILTTTDQKTAQKMLDSLQVAAVITIPKDFEKKAAEVPMALAHISFEGKVKSVPAEIDYTLFNANIDFSDDVRRSVDRSAAKFDAPHLGGEDEEGEIEAESAVLGQPAEVEDKEEIAEELRAMKRKNPYRINIEKYNLRETDVDWFNYQVIPVLILLIINVSLMGTALICATDIERKTARFLVLSPQRSWILVAGRLLSGTIASIIVLIPSIAIAVLAGVIKPPPGHWPALAAIFLATAVCASGIGAFLGSVMKGSRSIAMSASTISSYMFFLGGGFTTIPFLPHWLQDISAFIPFRYAIDGMREALFYATLDEIPKNLTILCLTAILTVLLGSYSVRKAWSD